MTKRYKRASACLLPPNEVQAGRFRLPLSAPQGPSFFHRPKSDETDRQERSPRDMADSRLVRFSTMKHKPPHGAHHAADPRSKKPYNRRLQASLIRRDRKGEWTKRTNHSDHVPSVGHASGQAPCGRWGKHFAANTRVLCGKYSSTLRKVRRRPPHAASAGNGSRRKALRKAEPPGHANVEKGRRQER